MLAWAAATRLSILVVVNAILAFPSSLSKVTSDAALPEDRSDRYQLILVAGCFLLSGFAALFYETVWLRQFSIYFGTSEQALAIVLGTYMGGLALGSLLAARYVDRLRRPLLTYGLLELGIAVTALLVPVSLSLVRRLQIMIFGGVDQPPEAGELSQILFTFGGALLATILPTTMMGATLPMLAKHVVHRDDHLGRRVGALYAINTLGAVFGTLTCAFVCLPRLGLLRSVLVAVAVNGLVFLIVWMIVRADRRSGQSDASTGEDFERAEAKVTGQAEEAGSRNWILWLIAASGAVSFGYEILFTRMLGHILGGSIFAFASMLASFLLGISLGGGIASRLARRRESSALGFFYAQCGTVGLALLSWYLLESLAGRINAAVVNDTELAMPREIWAILILLPPATAIGMSFPWAIRIHARDQRDAARSSAKVYAWNVVGGVSGAFLMGTYVLPMTSYQTAMLIALSANLVIASVLFARARPNLVHLAVVPACLILMVVMRPIQPEELLRVSAFENFQRRGSLVYVNAGRSATVTMHNDAGTFLLSTNGLPEAGTQPKGSLVSAASTAHWLGVLPALLRPEASTMLVVGFGSGVAAANAPQSIREIDVFELEEGMIEANRLVGRERERDALSDPRVNVILNDGRSGLALTEKKYDVIVSQPSHPWTAGASHLYTLEFAELAKQHLTEQGVCVLWMGREFVDADGLRSLGATLGNVFPHLNLYQPSPQTLLFVGSLSKLDLPQTPVEPRSEKDRSLFQQLGVDTPAALAAARILDDPAMRKMCSGAPMTTDNNNLLALRRIDFSDRLDAITEITQLINDHDPLLQQSGVDDLPPGISLLTVMLRRQQLGFVENADRLISVGSAEQQRFAKALSLWSMDDLEGSTKLLREVVRDDPQNQQAWVILFLLSQTGRLANDEPVEYASLKTHVSMPHLAIADAVLYQRDGQTSNMHETDQALATIHATDPLFGVATMLRIHWRNSDPQAGSQIQRGRENLRLIQRVSPYTEWDELLMLRLKAAAFASRPLIALTTAQSVANSVRNELHPPKDGIADSTPKKPVDREQLRINLINCLNVIAPLERDPRVPPHRFYGVRMYVESQLAELQSGG